MISVAKLYGLVLSGGKSTRMGTDKGLIRYHGIPQREHLYHLLGQVCEKTFISLREEQVKELPKDMKYIVDEDEYRGPYNGLLSAHHQFPEVAWLVLACDLPLIDADALKQLIAERNPKSLATAFAQRKNPLPEPLCAIWEPEALKTSVAYLESGVGTCPRKFLINNEVQLVYPKNPNVLLNANSEEDYRAALAKLTTA
ncbi:NTP transferase domain-containing protein [Flavobacteriaceae bacterium TP-CH-4]|uniref:Probable molybdenum cofactor guanylyltransferase n=1 Tax=Pelagihabitans pacificus TaxID=2696054 RepID=A0A967E739_9FLAO|nr:NTP transferase domain-containing protein [Pelagihabitans pacificus]NHF61172.1 NTP transferase domain-containing protein [Pelagihabitans pacificus]